MLWAPPLRTPAGPSDPAAPGLRIQQDGQYLQVNWNQSAPAIKGAKQAVLMITDGGYRRELLLDAAQLGSGSLAYLPVTNDVNFRLELHGSESMVSESLRVVTAPPRPPPAAAARPAPTIAQAAPAAKAAPVRQDPPKESKRQKSPPRPRRAFVDDGL
jgi:hypothetical protein